MLGGGGGGEGWRKCLGNCLHKLCPYDQQDFGVQSDSVMSQNHYGN